MPASWWWCWAATAAARRRCCAASPGHCAQHAGDVWLGRRRPDRHCRGEALRAARRGLAMMSQYAALVQRRSVLANVACGALGHHDGWFTALGGLPRSELRAAHGHLDEVGLRAPGASTRRHPVRRAGAARRDRPRARATPACMLADEPVASLDPEAAEDIMRLAQAPAQRLRAWPCCACCTRSTWRSIMPTVSSASATAVSPSTRHAVTCRATRCTSLYLSEAA